MPIFVNQVEITDDDVYREMQHHPASTAGEARAKAARALVIRQLLLQKAEEKGLLDTPGKPTSPGQEETAVEALLEQEVSVPKAGEAACRRYFEQNRERFGDPKTGKPWPFDLMLPRIRHYLLTRSMRTGISQYLKVLAGQARIAGFDLEESDHLLGP